MGYTLGMSNSERRRAIRHPVDYAGTLYLTRGRSVHVRIKNLGDLGALLQISDLETSVEAGDRAVLDHPMVDVAELRRATAGSVVRVDLDFEGDGVNRELALYFDGGDAPEGYEPEGYAPEGDSPVGDAP